MRLARFGLPFSVLTMVLSVVAFLTFGLNLGIDFKGGTLIEVQSNAAQADLADIRSRLEALNLGDVEVQGIGNSRDVLIRIATQAGGDAAQQEESGAAGQDQARGEQDRRDGHRAAGRAHDHEDRDRPAPRRSPAGAGTL